MSSRAGVDGVEHVTSFGTALLPLRDAEKYRQAMLAENSVSAVKDDIKSGMPSISTPPAQERLQLDRRPRHRVSPTLAVSNANG